MSAILTLNGGSSSLKCALFELAEGSLSTRYRFKLGNILGDASLEVSDADDSKVYQSALNLSDLTREQRHQGALNAVLEWLGKEEPNLQIKAFGHRVVHGGTQFSEPVLLTSGIMDELRKLIPLAPLHQPYNLKLVEACQALSPETPQIACFDTMFHAQQSELERRYAIPRKFHDEGIHKYGFHGLSYEYIQRQLEDVDSGKKNTIVCHLGAGASMCAIKEGVSIASSMGFTAVDGLPMGSRCGNIDPGVLLYLQRHYGMDADALESFIYKECGWQGVSGISADMLTLHQSDQPEAEEAIELFAYRVSLEIGRLTAALGGLEQLVFTGGIGENDTDLRRRVLERCGWLGAKADTQANLDGKPMISATDSAVLIRVIPTNEETMIATHTAEAI